MGRKSRTKPRNLQPAPRRSIRVPNRCWELWKKAAADMKVNQEQFILACCNHTARAILGIPSDRWEKIGIEDLKDLRGEEPDYGRRNRSIPTRRGRE